MSKPISFGFGKPKGSSSSAPAPSKISISQPAKPNSFSLKPAGSAAPKSNALKPASSALRGDDDDENDDDQEPKLEEVTGFGSTGAILTKPVEEKKKALVIENKGNQDWRRKARSKNLLPAEVRAVREGADVVMVEKNEVSTASGLQLAQTSEVVIATSDDTSVETTVVKPRTADEEALQALLNDDPDAPKGTAVIEARADIKFGTKPAEDESDFQDDIGSYPEPSTLEEYAAMPVEEFGMAMLRGMGKKRRANGEVIHLDSEKEKKEVKKRKQEGYLGIGAKAAPGMEGVEIGAWGKADMRKNNKGAGFFTPVMVRDAKTGETITEEELERRKQDAKKEEKDDWRERRDRNLERSRRDRNGDDGRHDRSNGSSRRRDRDEEDSDYSSSQSQRRRSRSRSQDRKRKHDHGDRYHSSSSRRDRDRDRDRGQDRHRDRDRDRDRERDDHRRHDSHRSRDYEKDDRRYRDRR